MLSAIKHTVSLVCTPTFESSWGPIPAAPSAGAGQTCARGLADGYGCIAHSRIFESQVGATAPTPPLSAALGLSLRRLAIAGNDTLGRWGLPPPHPRFPRCSACLTGGSPPRATRRLAGGGCRPHIPAFRCARLVLQMARYRGQRGAWQVGAAAPTPPLSAALGLSCRWLASYIRAATPLGKTIISPTHKRTEGRAPVWGSEFTSKRRRTTGGDPAETAVG
jgi:hypothetical protein